MLKLRFIVVDRTRAPFIKEGESFYLDRLKRYARTDWVETRPVRMTKGKAVQEVLEAEGREIIKKIRARDYIIALDREGKAYDSEGLATRIEKLAVRWACLSFVIGGPLGLSRLVTEKAHETLSLSRLTLTHEMSRLILLEQVYRAFTIINHERYHK